MAKILNEIYSPYFFVDCALSFINLTILMFSLLAHNVHIENYLSEIPLLTCGLSQLFFVLYFGDRLIDAVKLFFVFNVLNSSKISVSFNRPWYLH